jgi:hypothetical protein
VANESSARIVALPVLLPHFASLTNAYRSPLHDEIGPSIKLTRLEFQSRQPLLKNIEVRIVGIAFVTPSLMANWQELFGQWYGLAAEIKEMS